MRKVADWELHRAQPFFGRTWTWGALYAGFMATSRALDDPRFHDAMLSMAEKFHWQLRWLHPNADDQSIAQTYLELYLQKPEPGSALVTFALAWGVTHHILDRATYMPVIAKARARFANHFTRTIMTTFDIPG